MFKTGEVLKMLNVVWVFTPKKEASHCIPQKVLPTGEMLKMLNMLKGFWV